MGRGRARKALILFAAMGMFVSALGHALEEGGACSKLEGEDSQLCRTDKSFPGLEVLKIRTEQFPYKRFCEEHPEECNLKDSDSYITYTDKVLESLQKVSLEINKTLIFELDADQYSEEEFWALPLTGRGDCEDNALQKRKVLVEDYGFPRGALRMVTAFHKEQLYAHALLAVVTDQGTFILDQDNDPVLLWEKTPYIFEAAELPNGQWKRFVQNW